MGSQNLRKPELDARREIGIVVRDTRIAARMVTVFEGDRALARGPKTAPDVSDELTAEAVAG